jgi:putative redox protein
MTASIVYQGKLRCSAEHMQSGSVIETDAPTDNLGQGERFSPTDLVCVALATCAITTMAIKASDKNIKLDGTKLTVKKHMLADPRRIGAIDVILDINGRDITQEDRDYLQKIGDNCPVAKSLSSDMKLNIRYNWL